MANTSTHGECTGRNTQAALENLLGRPFQLEQAGLAALEEQIRQNPENHLEETIHALHRIECRMEFLQAPIQRFGGFSSLVPLQRM